MTYKFFYEAIEFKAMPFLAYIWSVAARRWYLLYLLIASK
jgi:hypothetical protein